MPSESMFVAFAKIGHFMRQWQRSGATEREVLQLANRDDIRRHALDLLRGRGHFVSHEFEIDCNTPLNAPDGLYVDNQGFRGKRIWSPDRCVLHFDPEQCVGDGMWGEELHKRISNPQAMCANVLRIMLEHTELIPRWCHEYPRVMFWGKTYVSEDQQTRMVPCLCKGLQGWMSDLVNVRSYFGSKEPAAIWGAS